MNSTAGSADDHAHIPVETVRMHDELSSKGASAAASPSETSAINNGNNRTSDVADSPSSFTRAAKVHPAGTVGGGAVSRASERAEEVGKVTVFNVGKYATGAQFEKLLAANGIEYKHARKPPSISHAVMTFDTEAQRASAIEKLGTLKGCKGGEMMRAIVSKNNQSRKRGAEEGRSEGDGAKRPRQEDHRTVAQATASLYSVKTYEEQIAYKEMTLRNDLFMKLPSLIRREWEKRAKEWKKNHWAKGKDKPPAIPPELRCPQWCKFFTRREENAPFDVLGMVPSPQQEGYRNKCEFTLSLDSEGRPTTGFRAGRFKAGVPITVESPRDCPQVHEVMQKLCVQLDSFMRTSPFLPYEDTTRVGVWRFLVIRRSVADDETMIKLVYNPTGIAGTEEWKKEEERLVKELSAGAEGDEGSKLVSIWVQEYAGVSSPDETSPMRLLWGKERIEEKLLGLRFTVSPSSFFQVNTKGAEALYSVVIENLELGDDVVVMDVCCGAGTIGICAASRGGAKRVFGSDLCAPAIEDARKNAEANGIKNCEFECGKAEDVVGHQLAKARKHHRQACEAAKVAAERGGEGKGMPAEPGTLQHGKLKFAAVLDPPRSGVHSKCLRSLRDTPAIERLVYVSCNPTKSLSADALILCCPESKSTRGMPFRPVKAIPVDMFPHTPHMELVMVFERIKEYETVNIVSSSSSASVEPPRPAAAAVAAAAAEEASPAGKVQRTTPPTAGGALSVATGSKAEADVGAIEPAEDG